jgi:hypothetical protein
VAAVTKLLMDVMRVWRALSPSARSGILSAVTERLKLDREIDMRKSLLSIATLCFGVIAMTLAAAPANAQATRTWVSGVGDDANPCSRTAPCKTFAGAISKTAPQGEINVLDPGGFGGVTITKAITISSENFEAGVLVSGTNGIVINAGAADVVTLVGLDIEGLGTGLDGINVFAAAAVYVLKSRIHHFTGNGINMHSSVSGSKLIVKDSFIFQNGTLNSNPLKGGVNINGTANVGSLIDTVVDSNQNFAVQASGAGNVIALTRSVATNSTNGINLVAGGSAICFGPSNVVGGAGSCSSVLFK